MSPTSYKHPSQLKFNHESFLFAFFFFLISAYNRFDRCVSLRPGVGGGVREFPLVVSRHHAGTSFLFLMLLGASRGSGS